MVLTLKIQQHPIGHQYLFHRRVSKEIRIVYICITIKIKAKKEDMAQTPSIPKGTKRLFTGSYGEKELYIRHDQIRIQTLWLLAAGNSRQWKIFRALMGKYGEEGDKLLFKILNSGDFLDLSPIAK